MFLSFWFDSAHKNKIFSVHQHLETADKRLLSLKLPNHISRALRPMKGNFGRPRSTAHSFYITLYLSWLEFYLIYNSSTSVMVVPVMAGILPNLQSQHFYLLSYAIHLLLKSKIFYQDVILAKCYLYLFVYQFHKIYPRRYMTINMHLPDTVGELSHLHLYSLFHFDDKNGYIMKLLHGTQNIPLQLASAVSASSFVPVLRERTIKEALREEEFVNKCYGVPKGVTFSIDENVVAVSSLKIFTPSAKEDELFFTLFPVSYHEAKSFPSIKVSGFTIRSSFSTKETRRKSTTVFLSSKRYFSINRSVQFTTINGDDYFVAFGNLFEVLPLKCYLNLITVCEKMTS